MNRYKTDARGWRKSSYSNGQSACVEVADGVPGMVPVRDSKTAGGPVLVVPAHSWTAFLASLDIDDA
ncbi:DUF397 domain-containing protein [Streptomyces johnsoniae]|uniref:DUF397 domain-containing protein n=1 Tax=Streptomyces johnsoniae TaxID=3075532 RepID=A0ABU2S4G9_9ACTN|nr:DUF397 domain-containing protein [Streptomyces sp. DSM 41886]MDT0443860.1 DUF397 domain-containing protein [Streptomyces sp. DSM 41886]